MPDTDGFIEVTSAPPAPTVAITNTNPMDDPRYKALLSQLKGWHGELLKQNLAENPALIGDYLGRMRLNANLLFAYLNVYIDNLTDLMQETAVKRQRLFEERLAMPKSSPSASETYAREMCRIDDANVKVLENRITQIKNEYERYNGICMYLQSRLKEFNTERIMG